MARTYAECERMIAACEQAGVPLFVAYYRRRLPLFLKVKELVASGAVGEVRFVSIRLTRPPSPEDFDREHLPWRVLPEIAGGGYFYDLGSHQLDFSGLRLWAGGGGTGTGLPIRPGSIRRWISSAGRSPLLRRGGG
jgi:predicted dehydrogenase